MDTIDKVLDFVEKTQLLGEQLKQAAAQQHLMLVEMMEMKKDGRTDDAAYLELSARSEALQIKIDHFKGIYAQNMAMLKDARKRNDNKKK
jgi:hypothetical protein